MSYVFGHAFACDACVFECPGHNKRADRLPLVKNLFQDSWVSLWVSLPCARHSLGQAIFLCQLCAVFLDGRRIVDSNKLSPQTQSLCRPKQMYCKQEVVSVSACFSRFLQMFRRSCLGFNLLILYKYLCNVHALNT